MITPHIAGMIVTMPMQQRQRDPLPAVPEEAGDPATLEQHRAEEAAHDEEERQPEAVQHLDERPDRGRCFVVHREPRDRGEGEPACSAIPSSMADARSASKS
jgi:hypothetical protein